MPTKKSSSAMDPPPNAWWTDDCRKSKTKVTAATKSLKHPGLTKRLKNLRIINLKRETAYHRHNVSKAKQGDFDTFVKDEVNEAQDSGKIWRKVSRLRHRYKLPEAPLWNGNRYTETNKEKADLLAETFAKANQTKYLGQAQKEFRTEQERNHEKPAEDNFKPFNLNLKRKELNKAIKGIKSASKSTGKDPISYKMIQQLPNTFLEILLDFFEACWESGAMPKAWKEAQVIAIHKEGKPRKDPNSYRPISLTPTLGKCMKELSKQDLNSTWKSMELYPCVKQGSEKEDPVLIIL